MASKINNKTINQTVDFWKQQHIGYRRLFANPQIEGLLKITDIILNLKPIEEKHIENFIDGLALIAVYKSEKDSEIMDKIEELTSPVLGALKTYIKSEDYQDNLIKKAISGERSINGIVNVQISPFEIKRFIKKTRQTPLTIDDVESIELKFTQSIIKRNESLKSVDLNLIETPTVESTFIPEKEIACQWILADRLPSFIKIENKLFERGIIDSKYKWQLDKKNIKLKKDLIDLLEILIEKKYFKTFVNGKKQKKFHYRQFISLRYGFPIGGLTDLSKKYKPNLLNALATFVWLHPFLDE